MIKNWWAIFHQPSDRGYTQYWPPTGKAYHWNCLIISLPNAWFHQRKIGCTIKNLILVVIPDKLSYNLSCIPEILFSKAPPLPVYAICFWWLNLNFLLVRTPWYFPELITNGCSLRTNWILGTFMYILILGSKSPHFGSRNPHVSWLHPRLSLWNILFVKDIRSQLWHSLITIVLHIPITVDPNVNDKHIPEHPPILCSFL